MTGLNTKRFVWTIVFLGITLAAIVMEVVAGIFHPAGTIPWTEYIAEYVPWPVQLAAYVVLAVWLPFHFWRHDHMRKDAFEQGRLVGRGEGHAKGHTEGWANGRAAAVHVASQMLRDQATGHAIQELRPGLAKAAEWVAHINDSMIDGG